MKTNLKPLKLLALCRSLRRSGVAVSGHHRGPVGLDCRAVMMSYTVDSWVWSVSVPSAVLGHLE